MTGPQNGFERGDTAPLSASREAPGSGHGQNSGGAASTPSDPGAQERTRPTFPPPGQGAGAPTSRPPQQGPVPAPGPQGPVHRSQPQNVPPQTTSGQGAPPPPHGAGSQPGTARYPGQSPSAPPNAPASQPPASQPPAGQPPAAQPPAAPTDQGRSEPAASPLAAAAAHLRDHDRDGGSGRITPLGWVWRGLALFAISVVSGLLWLLIDPGGGDKVADDKSSPDQPPQGRYEFITKKWEQGDGNCGDVSTEKIAEFFEQHPCQHLTRALYITTLNNGERVLTSVVTAKMPTAASASQLEKLTTRNGTGNIEDLVSAGRPVPDDYPDLDGDLGYASQQQGRLVVIGESAYFRNPNRDDARLKGVTVDALRLGHAQDQRPR